VPNNKLTIPNHVAIMLDGNRRWAKKRGLKPWEGHLAGIGERAEAVVKSAQGLGIKYLTLWAGSYDNLTKRSDVEVRFLNQAYCEFIKKALNDDFVVNERVKVNFLGEWEDLLEEETVKLIKEVLEKTKDYNNLYLNILVGYNGDRELLDTINRLIENGEKNITPETLKSYLWTNNMPPVDLMIRTGVEGDPHNSTGFMMWDMRDTQFEFSKILWPDFTKDDFKNSVGNFSSRQKRLGR